MSNFITVHGAQVVIPRAWDDVSVYRFLPPKQSLTDVRAVGKHHREALANVVVTRHARSEGETPSSFFAEHNGRLQAEATRFGVRDSGTKDYLGQPTTWQEIELDDRASGLTVMQRQVLLPGWEGEWVLLTLTGNRQDLERMAQEMGL